MPKLTDRVPLDESLADHRELLDDLQCGILSGHGRPRTHYFFLSFTGADQAVRVLKALANGEVLGSKLESELVSRGRRKEWLAMKAAAGASAPPTPPVGFSTNLLLTARCYTQFLSKAEPPSDAAFRDGMTGRDGKRSSGAPKLNDPASLWPGPPIHALYQVGYTLDAPSWDEAHAAIVAYLQGEGVSYAERAGYVLKHPTESYSIEPFGYRDAVSQPLFFKDDLAAQIPDEGAAATVQGGAWSSFASLSLVLVPDRNGTTPQACGSYVAYRKLKQNVDLFYNQAQLLAGEVSTPANPLSRDDVADRLMGRKVSGWPLEPSLNYNDFNYERGVCPAHAHTRKVNPRDIYSREQRLVRRSTVFGPRLVRTTDGRPDVPARSEDPSMALEDVGLLFFSCQARIAEQFEFIQANWANSLLSGADTVIGQLPADTKNFIGLNRSGLRLEYRPVVAVQEGEYFFVPSISFFVSNKL